MIQSKRHLEIVFMHRILLQHENHVWIKHFLDMDKLPVKILQNVFALSISHYGEVRSYAQDLLNKFLGRTPRESHSLILHQLVDCLKPGVTHQKFKGALYILYSDSKLGFFNCWEFLAVLMPALVQAQHSDKPSIVELLKEISIRCNRTYTDFLLDTMPIHIPKVTPELLNAVDSDGNCDKNHVENTCVMEIEEANSHEEENPHFVALEKELCSMVRGGSLHWRHTQMAIGMLYTLTVPHHQPPADLLELWMQCLIHDDRNIRSVAFQAIECILKSLKVKRKCVRIEAPKQAEVKQPGKFEPNQKDPSVSFLFAIGKSLYVTSLLYFGF